jgi:hypothetical protein
MAMKEITITIDPATAGVEVDLEGFQGKGCQAVIEGFARAAGTNANITHKREFNAPIIAANRLKQGK